MTRIRQVRKGFFNNWLFFLPIAIVFFFGVSVYRFYQQRVWKYEGRFNVLNIDNLSLTSYYGDSGNILVKFPPDYYTDVAGGYGSYKIKDVLQLAGSEKKKEEILKNTFSNLLGIPIDAFSKKLTLWDKFTIWRKKQQRQKSIEEIDLAKLPVETEEILVDGTKIKKIDPQKVDFYLNEAFWERDLREENLKIGVFNASETSGLAVSIARLIGNIGGKVVEAGNFDGKVNSCQIQTTTQSVKSVTVQRIRQIFPNCAFEIKNIDPRFNLVIIVV